MPTGVDFSFFATAVSLSPSCSLRATWNTAMAMATPPGSNNANAAAKTGNDSFHHVLSDNQLSIDNSLPTGNSLVMLFRQLVFRTRLDLGTSF